MASGTSEQCRLLGNAGLDRVAVRVLSESSSGQSREQALWVVSNLAGDCAELRDKLLELVLYFPHRSLKLGVFFGNFRAAWASSWIFLRTRAPARSSNEPPPGPFLT